MTLDMHSRPRQKPEGVGTNRPRKGLLRRMQKIWTASNCHHNYSTKTETKNLFFLTKSKTRFWEWAQMQIGVVS